MAFEPANFTGASPTWNYISETDPSTVVGYPQYFIWDAPSSNPGVLVGDAVNMSCSDGNFTSTVKIAAEHGLFLVEPPKPA
jgi:hypothetical protein